jgi:hypothetical protein
MNKSGDGMYNMRPIIYTYRFILNMYIIVQILYTKFRSSTKEQILDALTQKQNEKTKMYITMWDDGNVHVFYYSNYLTICIIL